MRRVSSIKQLVLIVFAILFAVGIGAVSFHEGRRYQVKADTVTIANDGCFDCYMGLVALNSTNRFGSVDMRYGLDREMDHTAWILADMTLKYPSFVGPSQYQLLRRVRDYRKIYGSHYYTKGDQVNPAIVDQKVSEAMTYFASIHDTNEWLSYHGEDSDLIHEIEAQQKK